MEKLNIFRAGRHIAKSGQAIEFSESDLDAMVKAYNPTVHEAPLVAGHPKGDAPAYGWVGSLSFEEGNVFALPQQVDAEFQEIVNSGKFKKISASFYTPDAPTNPVPGVYYLRHVGFLGAQPPAVKGLKDAHFGEAETGVIEFGDYGAGTVADLFYGLREWFIDKYGIEEANKALPLWPIDDLEAYSRQPTESELASETAPEYSETSKAQNAPTASQSEAEQQLADRERALNLRASELRRNEHLAFCEALIKDGRLPPGHKDGLAALMMSLSDTDVVEFDEGKSENPLAWLKTFLQSLPKQVEFYELKPEPDKQPLTANFTAAPGFTANADKLELHAKAQAYQKANPETTYIEAVKAVGGQ
jgi:hypothetical protein